MKYKFSWGVGIAIFYSVFVLFLISNVIFSLFQNTDLVTEDYYNKELDFQETIHTLERTKRLNEDLNIIQGSNTIAIQFPDTLTRKKIKGEIYLYRPADATADKKIKLVFNENNFHTLDTREFKKGLWILKIDWSIGDSSYYKEEKIMIQ